MIPKIDNPNEKEVTILFMLSIISVTKRKIIIESEIASQTNYDTGQILYISIRSNSAFQYSRSFIPSLNKRSAYELNGILQ